MLKQSGKQKGIPYADNADISKHSSPSGANIFVR